MSDSTPRSLREELEIRVVALLTGELSEADADELEKILTVDEELAAYRDRMATVMGHIHDARQEIAPEEGLRLSDERRTEIFGEVNPYEISTPPKKKEVNFQRRFLEWAAVIAVLFVLGAMLVPTVGAVKKKSSEAARRSDERQHQIAMQMAELEAQEMADEEVMVALETSISAERIEGTPQPVMMAPPPPLAPSVLRAQQTMPRRESIAAKEAVVPDLSVTQNEVGFGRGFAGSPGVITEENLSEEIVDVVHFGMIMDEPLAIDQIESESKFDFDSVDVAKVAKTRGRDEQNLRSDMEGDEIALAKSNRRRPSDPFAPFGSGAQEKSSTAMKQEVAELAGYDSADGFANVDPFASEPASKPIGGVVAKKKEQSKDMYAGYFDVADDSSKLDEFFEEAGVSRDSANAALYFDSDLLADVSLGRAGIQTSEVAEDHGGPSVGDKLDRIVIPRVNFSGMPLSRVVETLSELSHEYDPAKEGVNLVYLPIDESDPRVNISLRNLTLAQVLEFVTQQVDHLVDVSEVGGLVMVKPQHHLSSIERFAESRSKNTRQTPKSEKHTREEPISTFSLNVSDVSFELAQAALENSRVPNPERIRSEEFLNSFQYGDPTPQPDEPVSLNWEIADLPYAHGRQVVRFSLQTGAAGRSAGQPLNLNLLVDNSGSMQRPDRRAIMEQSLQSLKDKLQPNDQLNVVLFSRQPKLIANARTPHEQQVAVDTALAYRPEGGTNIEAALDAAYSNAQQNFDPAASNRVILMTDGAANLGEVNAPELAKKVIENRKQGIALDAYGIGWDDYNDALLEEITRNGDGRYAFLNSPDTAAEDFSEKLAGSLRVAAADVKVQIVWNPERVTTYRQVGYDLHQLKTEDFRDNTVDAAEIGEAESGTALYVVQINDSEDAIGRLGTLHVRYRDPSTNTYKEQEWPLEMPRSIPSLEVASPSLRLATTSALFAERLARNPYAADVSFDELSQLSSDLPQAFPTQQRVVDLQNMIQNARILLGDAN